MTRETYHTLRDRLRKRHEVILLGAILLVALALRLYQLEQDSFWIDELSQINAARQPWRLVPKAALAHDGSAPIDYLVTHFVYYHIGRSEGILRLPAVLWGVLAVATVYFLGKRMFDKTTGFLAAAMLAILPSHVYYSQEVRPYSLPALMVLVATFAFYRALERNTRGAWALYGVALVVGMYSHYYVAVVGILHGAYIVLMALAKRLPWDRLLPYVVVAGLAGLLFLPWVLADDFKSGYSFQWPSMSIVLSAPFVPGDPSDALIAEPHSLCLFAGFAGASALAGVVLAFKGRSAARNNMALIGLVSIMGMAVALVLDFLAAHFFPARHFLPYAPALVLLVAAGALGVVRAVARWLGRAEARDKIVAIAAVVMVVFAATTLFGSLSEAYRYQKQDWRGVGRYLLQYAKPGDAIVLRSTHNIVLYAPELKAKVIALRNKETITQSSKTHLRVWIVADWSSRFELIKRDAARWLKTEKPLQVPGFSGLGLYLYSAELSPEELRASLKQW